MISEMIETKALSANDFKAAAQEVADKTGYTLPSVERSMLKVKNVTSKSFGIVAHPLRMKKSYLISFCGIPACPLR
ncbi:MAG: hypothetical protein R2860_10305 [Desulfobacterales bacterium]